MKIEVHLIGAECRPDLPDPKRSQTGSKWQARPAHRLREIRAALHYHECRGSADHSLGIPGTMPDRGMVDDRVEHQTEASSVLHNMIRSRRQGLPPGNR